MIRLTKVSLINGVYVDVLLETIAFCRELIKGAPAGLLPDCYHHSAWAMLKLHNLDGAKEILHEGLVACREDSLGISQVSRTIPTVITMMPERHFRVEQSDTSPPALTPPDSKPAGGDRCRTGRLRDGTGLRAEGRAQRQEEAWPESRHICHSMD
jgi:hypothetical protein